MVYKHLTGMEAKPENSINVGSFDVREFYHIDDLFSFRVSNAVVQRWFKTEDFLIVKLKDFTDTHVVFEFYRDNKVIKTYEAPNRDIFIFRIRR